LEHHWSVPSIEKEILCQQVQATMGGYQIADTFEQLEERFPKLWSEEDDTHDEQAERVLNMLGSLPDDPMTSPKKNVRFSFEASRSGSEELRNSSVHSLEELLQRTTSAGTNNDKEGNQSRFHQSFSTYEDVQSTAKRDNKSSSKRDSGRTYKNSSTSTRKKKKEDLLTSNSDHHNSRKQQQQQQQQRQLRRVGSDSTLLSHGGDFHKQADDVNDIWNQFAGPMKCAAAAPSPRRIPSSASSQIRRTSISNSLKAMDGAVAAAAAAAAEQPSQRRLLSHKKSSSLTDLHQGLKSRSGGEKPTTPQQENKIGHRPTGRRRSLDHNVRDYYDTTNLRKNLQVAATASREPPKERKSPAATNDTKEPPERRPLQRQNSSSLTDLHKGLRSRGGSTKKHSAAAGEESRKKRPIQRRRSLDHHVGSLDQPADYSLWDVDIDLKSKEDNPSEEENAAAAATDHSSNHSFTSNNLHQPDDDDGDDDDDEEEPHHQSTSSLSLSVSEHGVKPTSYLDRLKMHKSMSHNGKKDQRDDVARPKKKVANPKYINLSATASTLQRQCDPAAAVLKNHQNNNTSILTTPVTKSYQDRMKQHNSMEDTDHHKIIISTDPFAALPQKSGHGPLKIRSEHQNRCNHKMTTDDFFLLSSSGKSKSKSEHYLSSAIIPKPSSRDRLNSHKNIRTAVVEDDSDDGDDHDEDEFATNYTAKAPATAARDRVRSVEVRLSEHSSGAGHKAPLPRPSKQSDGGMDKSSHKQQHQGKQDGRHMDTSSYRQQLGTRKGGGMDTLSNRQQQQGRRKGGDMDKSSHRQQQGRQKGGDIDTSSHRQQQGRRKGCNMDTSSHRQQPGRRKGRDMDTSSHRQQQGRRKVGEMDTSSYRQQQGRRKSGDMDTSSYRQQKGSAENAGSRRSEQSSPEQIPSKHDNLAGLRKDDKSPDVANNSNSKNVEESKEPGVARDSARGRSSICSGKSTNDSHISSNKDEYESTRAGSKAADYVKRRSRSKIRGRNRSDDDNEKERQQKKVERSRSKSRKPTTEGRARSRSRRKRSSNNSLEEKEESRKNRARSRSRHPSSKSEKNDRARSKSRKRNSEKEKLSGSSTTASTSLSSIPQEVLVDNSSHANKELFVVKCLDDDLINVIDINALNAQFTTFDSLPTPDDTPQYP
jgi:hypothetical protein